SSWPTGPLSSKTRITSGPSLAGVTSSYGSGVLCSRHPWVWWDLPIGLIRDFPRSNEKGIRGGLECSYTARRHRGREGARRRQGAGFGGRAAALEEGTDRFSLSIVKPKKVKHISSVVCSPKRTRRGGWAVWRGLPALLS